MELIPSSVGSNGALPVRPNRVEVQPDLGDQQSMRGKDLTKQILRGEWCVQTHFHLRDLREERDTILGDLGSLRCPYRLCLTWQRSCRPNLGWDRPWLEEHHRRGMRSDRSWPQ